MSTARDEALAALQSGDIQTAITRLEAAVQEDPSDYDACLYLGGAYGQAGRPLDAIKSVTQAVQLQPANAQARYNLGVAMEQGGYNDQALQVYNQALHLQPDYPNAQQAVERLHASSNQGFGAPVTASSSTTGSGQQFQQEQPQTTQQPTQQFAQPAVFGQQQAAPLPFNPLASPGQTQAAPFNPLAPPTQSAQPTQAFTPPVQQSPAFARPTIPVGQPQQTGEAGLGSYMAPPPPAARPAPGYGAPAAYGARPGAYSAPSYDDEFKLGQAFKDFFRALFTPRVLLSDMAGCDTAKSAWALFVVYAIFSITAAAVNFVLHMSTPGVMPPVVTFLLSLLGIPFLLVTWAIFAGIVQMLSRAFGSSLRYGASFRSVVYAAAPYVASTLLLSIVGGFMMPQLQNAMLGGGGAGIGGAQQTPMPGTFGTGASTRSSSHLGKSVTPGKHSSGTNASASGIGSSANNPFGSSRRQFGGAGSSAGNPFGGAGSSAGSPFGAGYMPTGPGAANPFAMFQAMAGYFVFAGSVMLVGIIWGIGLLGVAVSNIHEVSGGAGAGVAILSAIIAMVLGVGAYIVFVGAIMAAIMSSMAH